MTTAAAAAVTPNGKNGHTAPPPPSATPPKFVASQLLDISLIEADPHNPRKDFPKEELNELISSVMLFGVRQPIEVRAIGPGGATAKDGVVGLKYRIVFGERRFRAARAAGLKQIPAIVRALSDIEAAEVQLDENLKRADLSPLEIAGGYRRQLDLGRTMDQLCERAGKKRTQVYEMLALLNLGDEGRKALGEKRLTTSNAQLVASYAKSIQPKAVTLIEGDQFHAQLSYKEARATLERELLVDLRKAPFEVKQEGIPCASGAKSCAVCPRRVANQPELFPDAKNGDACTDPEAYRGKVHAEMKKVVEAKGYKLLSPKEAPPAELFWNDGRGPVNEKSGYVEASEACHDDQQSRRYVELLQPDQLKKLVRVAIDNSDKPRQLLERAGLAREVKKAGLIKERKVGKPSAPSSSSTSAKSASAAPKHHRELPDFDDVVDTACVEAMVKRVEEKGFTPRLLRVLAFYLGQNSYQLLKRRFNEEHRDPAEKKLKALIAKAKPDELAGLFFEAACDQNLEYLRGSQADDLLEGMDVDRKKVEVETKRVHPILWSEDAHGASGIGTKNAARYEIERDGKSWVLTKSKDAAGLVFDSLEKAKAKAAAVETGASSWASPDVTPAKKLDPLDSPAVAKAKAKAAAKRAVKKDGKR